MAKLLDEASSQLDQFEQDIQTSYEQLNQCQDIDQLNEQLALVDGLTQRLNGFSHELAGLLAALSDQELPQAKNLFHRLKSLLEANLSQAQMQREQAKQGVLSLRQTSAGAAAYQAVKKQR